MMRIKHIVVFCFVGVTGLLQAQDAHYSQFYRDPLYTNPANTGAFEGRYRFEGHHRNQWQAIGRPFETFGISADAANFLKLPALGVGINVFNDVAGDGNLSNLQIQGALSYTLRLNTDSTSLLTFGLQGGWYRKQIDFDALFFDDQYVNGMFQPGITSAEQITQSATNSFNTHAGALYRKRTGTFTGYSIGFALHNLTTPNQSFTTDDIPLDMRFTLHANLETELTPTLNALPGILAMRQGPHSELLLGSNFRYFLDKRPYSLLAVQLGGWYRVQDAAVIFAGVDWGNWQFGASYDINTSALRQATGNRGGFEFSVIYIVKHILPKRLRFKNCRDFL
jgi:type IX secretion system PorP/SprF family membrane protein